MGEAYRDEPILTRPERPNSCGRVRVVMQASPGRAAVEWRAPLDSALVHNQAAIARREGMTRARVTQIMSLLRLAPAIQEHILAMSVTALRTTISERVLRPIAQLRDPRTQMAEFTVLCAKVA